MSEKIDSDWSSETGSNAAGKADSKPQADVRVGAERSRIYVEGMVRH